MPLLNSKHFVFENSKNSKTFKSAEAAADRKLTKTSLEERAKVAMRRDRASKLLAADAQSVRREAEEMTAMFARMGVSHLEKT